MQEFIQAYVVRKLVNLSMTSPGATQHKPLTTLIIIRIPPWHWLNHATYAFPIPVATDWRPDSPLSQFMPPCDFCSLRASVSKFSHLSLLLPPFLCNSTNSLNERIDFLVGSLTNQVSLPCWTLALFCEPPSHSIQHSYSFIFISINLWLLNSHPLLVRAARFSALLTNHSNIQPRAKHLLGPHGIFAWWMNEC